MSDGIILDIPEVIRIYNVSKSITTSTRLYSSSIISQTKIPMITNSDISLIACIGFAVLILSTVIGNTLVLSALFLDKRLHKPSFFLIANMAMADLLLGMSVLPFSSIHELLNDRWIFGQTFCSAWLAFDVLCCTASIIALMAVSIDRYIGVTRPLTYSTIMTTRRTIYLIIIVWAISILTSVVPLFGLTDRGKISKDLQNSYENSQTCEVNKNTFYTIFSSMISFYIPVIILLILYSRVYQEAKKQGQKLENDKRRLYEIDYQIAARQKQQNHSNGYSRTNHPVPPTPPPVPSNQLDQNKNEFSLTLENHPDEQTSLAADGVQLKKDNSDSKVKNDDDTSNSGSSIAPLRKSRIRRILGKRLYSSIKRNSILHTHSNLLHYNNQISQNDELLIIKRKLHNLKREQKAFRTVGLILGALLICWLPFFVTLPVMSILKHQEVIKDENTENTWFKITFWLGYCNSALNPFVYAFSNRAIRRAFRQVIFRRCCYFSRKKSRNEQINNRRKRADSGSLTTETSQIMQKRTNSFSTDVNRPLAKIENDLNISSNSPLQATTSTGPVVSFAEFLSETGDDDDDDDKKSNPESITTSPSKNHAPV